MRIGPITVRWTKDMTGAASEAQRLDLERNRCIAGQYHDIQALRQANAQMRQAMVQLLHRCEGRASKKKVNV